MLNVPFDVAGQTRFAARAQSRCPEEGAPLTTAQLSIWIDHALHPHKPIYNTGQIIEIRCALDRTAFEQALRAVVAKHDALRLRFRPGADIRQMIEPQVDIDLGFRDFAPRAAAEADAKEWLLREFWRPLSPTASPLFAFYLARVSADRFLWLQKYHHLVIDATGRQIVAKDVADIYDALTSKRNNLLANAPSYLDAVDSERRYFESEQYALDRAYWLRRFASPVVPLVERAGRVGDKSTNGRATRVELGLDAPLAAKLKALAKTCKVSLFKLLLLLIWVALFRRYDRTEMVFGVPVGNRKTEAEKATVGVFAKLIPFRLALDPDATVAAALAILSAQFDQDVAHQQYPSDHVSRGCAWRPKASIGIFDVVVNYVRNDYGFDIGGEPIVCKNVSSGFAVPWGFMALDYRRGDGLDLFLDYDRGLIGRTAMDEVTAHLRRLFVADLALPHLTLRDLARCGVEPGGVLPARSGEAAAPARAMRDNEIDAPGVGDAGRAHASDRMHVTARLQALWESTLGHSPASEDEDFFAAGGDSLKAICFVAECSQAFGMELPLTMLFENPTMRMLAASIEQARGTNGILSEPRLITLRAGDASPPLILVHPVGGTVTCYRDLAASLPGERPVYGLRVSGFYEGEELAPSLEQMAEEYLDVLAPLDRSAFHLAGWSFGGAVAFEMARRARRREWTPQSLALIDTPFRVERGTRDDCAALASVLAAAVGLKSLSSAVVPRNAEQVLEMVCEAHDGASRPELKTFLRRVLLVVENARKLRREHQFDTYDGDVTLIEASGGFGGEPLDCAAWRQLISGRVRVIEVAAPHEAVVFAPFARIVGAILEDAMRIERPKEACHDRR